jgi:hypothetical protein
MMATKYIVDTHALLWYIAGDPQLGNNAKSVLQDATSEIIYSGCGELSLHGGKRSSTNRLTISAGGNPNIAAWSCNQASSCGVSSMVSVNLRLLQSCK